MRFFTKEKKEISGPKVRFEAFSELIGKPRSVVQKIIKEKSVGEPAGGAELTWLMNKKYWDAPEASPFKDGNVYFFFGTKNIVGVPSVYWNGTSFTRHDSYLSLLWGPSNRAVLRDNA